MRWPKPIREAILDRAAGLCEGCGAPIPTDVNIHHRQYVSRGGRSVVANGIALCGKGNVLAFGCHGRAHTRAGEELGWSVRSGFNPRNVAVVYRGGVVWLTDDGRAEPVGETEF